MNLFNPKSKRFTPLVKETDFDKGGGIIGDSPLSIVIRRNEIETAYILLKDFHTDPNTINVEGKSPLDLANEIGMLGSELNTFMPLFSLIIEAPTQLIASGSP